MKRLNLDFSLSDDAETGLETVYASIPAVEVTGYLGTGHQLAHGYLAHTDHWHDPTFARLARARGDRPVAYLGSITVSRHARGAGIGSEALEAFISYVEARGAVAIFLYAAPTDRDGLDIYNLIEWYGRHGFQQVKSDRGFCIAMLRGRQRRRK